MMEAQEIVDTPLGWMVLKGDHESIYESKWVSEDDLTIGKGTLPAIWKKEAQQQIGAYFKKERTTFSLPLAPRGTAFQSLIWSELQKITFGTTMSYAEISSPDQARAAGAAIGANPLLLLIPCHRVIGSDGSLTGYAGGLERKEALLELEGAHLAQQLSLF